MSHREPFALQIMRCIAAVAFMAGAAYCLSQSSVQNAYAIGAGFWTLSALFSMFFPPVQEWP